MMLEIPRQERNHGVDNNAEDEIDIQFNSDRSLKGPLGLWNFPSSLFI